MRPTVVLSLRHFRRVMIVSIDKSVVEEDIVDACDAEARAEIE